MLTTNEKQWLKDRNEHPENRFCRWCLYNEVRGREEEEGIWCSCSAEDDESAFFECIVEHYYFNRIWDAVNFDKLVTARIAFNVAHKEENNPCMDKGQCMPTGCAACWLRQARLQIEEELDRDDG